ncbi:MAG: hypothetical protein Q4A44_04230 [Bacteroidales bacterium]|nr:hypothetical protein [Bacteroidales bacterium]
MKRLLTLIFTLSFVLMACNNDDIVNKPTEIQLSTDAPKNQQGHIVVSAQGGTYAVYITNYKYFYLDKYAFFENGKSIADKIEMPPHPSASSSTETHVRSEWFSAVALGNKLTITFKANASSKTRLLKTHISFANVEKPITFLQAAE